MAESERMKKPRPRVPHVLWRLFGRRARTLLDTIISLIPSPNPPCHCKPHSSSSCLACCQCRSSFLVRPDDPKPYRTLMAHCYVVVPDAAPPQQPWSPTRRWPQLQIVSRTIELMLSERSNNVLCNGFDKESSTSPAVELLTSSAWVLLLDRVGDVSMHYLLRHTMIFLPDFLNGHIQISGESITRLNLKTRRGTRRLPYQDSTLLHHGSGSRKKGKQNDNAVSSLERKIHRRASSCEEQLPTIKEGCTLSEVSTDECSQHNANGGTVDSRKRTRPFRWQRVKKRKQSDLEEVNDHNLDGRSKPPRVAPCSSKQSSQDQRAGAPSQCCCSFLFQAPTAISDKALIDREHMFYRVDHSQSLFPKNHILNKLKLRVADANQLIKEIFGAPLGPGKCEQRHGSRTCSADSACLHRSLIKKLKVLIRRAKRCEHMKLLNKHCPVQNLETIITNGADSATEMTGSSEVDKSPAPHELYCSKHQVVSFIWAVCRSIIPLELLGSSSNWRVWKRNIFRFIGLRRYEKFCLSQCMQKLKLTAFCFFSYEPGSSYLGDHLLISSEGKTVKQLNDSKDKMRTRLVKCWVYWLFTNLIVPIVQSNFYVTETEQGQRDIFYYRKLVWCELAERTISDLKGQTLLHLNVDSVRDIIRMRNFGFSKLRLLPKRNGMRAVANLRACSRMPEQGWYWNNQLFGKQKPRRGCRRHQYFKSVNHVLRDLHIILKDVWWCGPEKLGSSVFSYNDIYKKLCPFVISLKVSGIMQSAYVVVADVAKAFDSIDQDKLLSVMKKVIDQDCYHLKKTHEIVCTEKSMWNHESILLKKHTILSCNSVPRPSIRYRLLHRVLVNQESDYHLRNEDLFRLLAEHVMNNILLLDGEFYLQTNGISQGSILSSLLCSFYFADLEKNVIFPYLEKTCNDDSPLLENNCDEMSLPCAQNILMRYIDDILFITTSRKQATNFLKRLQRGFQTYNCHLNSEKSGTNFECEGVSNSRSLASADGQLFLRWSGLLLNCQTLEIQADYGRYLDNHLSSSLTISWQNKLNQNLGKKLCRFLQPKCHPILFDQNINSEQVVRLNVYQIFLLAAMKFHCYVKGLSRICRLQPASFSIPVVNSTRYLHTHLMKLMSRISSRSNIYPVFKLARGEVEWLGLSAYIRVLKRKHWCHKKLLAILRCKLQAHRISKNVPPRLKYAVDDSHSSVLWKIKY
uniref:Telomerase reverse transcriptase n=1 Tax=Kalanchoe fedtschenkoi TaxID=63787 RepID=A0A7N0R959_KALFE